MGPDAPVDPRTSLRFCSLFSLFPTISRRRFLTLPLLVVSLFFDHIEVIYTAQPPYNVALIMSAAFVVGVFCFVTADLARIGIA